MRPQLPALVVYAAVGIVACWLLVLFMRIAVGAPPVDADPALAPWFQGLQNPRTGAFCCSIADCRPVEYRVAGSGYEIHRPAGAWLAVPDEAVLARSDNPTGFAIACIHEAPSPTVLCFILPAQV